jgi:predicted MFS family arabinose efflux permease
MMSAGFMVIPYITLYMQANAGVPAADVPYIYLFGGLATLVSARYFGRLTDKKGKQPTFALLAVLLCGPLLALTVLPPWPLPALIGVSTALFVVMSGRMIPGMALVSSVADPAMRGTFMALNAAAQSAAMGLAAMAGGHLISRDAGGHIEGYWMAGLAGVVLSLLSVVVSRKLVLHMSAGVQRQP